MPRLVKNIEGTIFDTLTGNIYCFSSVSGLIQSEDYINLNGLIAYLQTFTQAYYIETIQKPLMFGLKNQYNLPTITLEISY